MEIQPKTNPGTSGCIASGPDILDSVKTTTETETFTYTWKIEDCRKLIAITTYNHHIVSPTFTTYTNTDVHFQMVFYPRGEVGDEPDESYFPTGYNQMFATGNPLYAPDCASSLYVRAYRSHAQSSGSSQDLEAHVHVTLPSSSPWRVRDLASKLIRKNPRNSKPSDPPYCADFKRLVRLDSLMDRSHGYLKDDALTIVYEVGCMATGILRGRPIDYRLPEA